LKIIRGNKGFASAQLFTDRPSTNCFKVQTNLYGNCVIGCHSNNLPTTTTR